MLRVDIDPPEYRSDYNTEGQYDHTNVKNNRPKTCPKSPKIFKKITPEIAKK